MSDGPSVHLDHVSKQFDRRTVLDDVSFEYHGARAVGYLGPNGAGKTTTLKLLTGLLQPNGGQLLVDGIDVTEHPREALHHLGALIETPEPYPTLTCQEAIEMVGEFRGVPPEEIKSGIRKYAELLELPPLDRRTGKLSKGQRQRVVLAGTLIGDPPVLLLDEPTSGLDPAERVRVRNVLLELKKERLVIMSSHLLGEVTDICDDVIFINEGKLIWRGTVGEVEAKFRVRELEVDFLEPVPIERFRELEHLVVGVRPLGDRRFQLGFDGSDRSRATILSACQRLGSVIAFGTVGSALEDMYVQLIDAGQGPPPPPPLSAG